MRLPIKIFILYFLLVFGYVVAEGKCNPESVKAKDIMACIHMSHSIIDGMLNDRYSVILKKENFPYGSTLKEGERLWMAYRDSKCKYIYESIYPGMEAEVERESCLLSLTYSRLLELIYIESSVRDTSLERLLMRTEWRERYDSLDAGTMGVEESAYFMKNCELVGALYGESKENCMKRMWVQNL
ncbi:uncharacterized protein YecT (DUF1311 family) [Metapseudomonas resinovorans]|uniref:lysozyme inhibitor LprI family protein n=1 Tax=Metapseudomonas resinovorans TaxID=53412 RepID=UPI003D1B66E1